MNLYLYGGIFLVVIILIWYFFASGPKWAGKWGQKDRNEFIRINKNNTFVTSDGINGTYQIIDGNTFSMSFGPQSVKVIYDPNKDTLTMDMGGRSSGPGGNSPPPVLIRK